MMVNKVHIKAMLGEVVGYSSGWYPLSSQAYVHVKVGRDTIRVTVDRRQLAYIRKEYPVGEAVELDYSGRWVIKGRVTTTDRDIIGLLDDVY